MSGFFIVCLPGFSRRALFSLESQTDSADVKAADSVDLIKYVVTK
ncbi:hypothetical protein BN133_894 [Cronobacter dublinensis 582]|nr:hypothetical protein BN133_894 [Cronobacter dublinensis 582]